MSIEDSEALINRYIEACGNHCEPYIVIKRLSEFAFEWDDQSLSNVIFENTKELGCVRCEWHSMSEYDGKELLKTILGESLLLEYPPFGKTSKCNLSEFLEELYKLVGSGVFLSNTVSYGQGARTYGQIFPDSERYELDVGVSIVTGEWFVFFGHRGFE